MRNILHHEQTYGKVAPMANADQDAHPDRHADGCTCNDCNYEAWKQANK